MTGDAIFFLLLSKLKSRYKDINNLLTKNNKSHTVIFSSLLDGYCKHEYHIILELNEFPILECLLPNGNYFLMSTTKMMSHFDGKDYKLLYSDYWWHDRDFFQKALPFTEGKTKVLKYFSYDKSEFLYEIDSGEPFDAAHGCVLYNMRKIYNERPFIPPTW
jgi:hypothetical protein